MRFNPALWAIVAASVLSSAPVASAAALKSPAGKNDISKGTEVIEPGSKEAEALHAADKASKFAPKDNTFVENFEKGSTFKKSEPKLSDQKIDVPDNELLTPESNKKAAATKDDTNPVVVNDYDPNNMGVSSDGKTQAQEHTQKDSEASPKEGPGGSTGSSSGSTTDSTAKKPVQAPKKTTTTTTTTAASSWSDKVFSYLNYKNGNALDGNNPAESADALHALVVSISMTVLSEIGDKTFLIAAILAMRYNRVTIFSAAFSALAVMTVISGLIGHALPTFLSRRASALIAGCLFLFFGFSLFREGIAMEKNASVEEELEEVETEINEKTHTEDLELGLGDGEKSAPKPTIKRTASNPRISGDGLDTVAGDASLYAPRPKRSNAGGALKSITEGLGNLFGLILSPIWVQAFAMTFFAEWGDRSQIATIAMAAGSDYWWVIIGSIFGHFLCTGSAVIGGKLLATRITLKNVTLTGAALFIVFSLVYFWEFLSA